MDVWVPAIPEISGDAAAFLLFVIAWVVQDRLLHRTQWLHETSAFVEQVRTEKLRLGRTLVKEEVGRSNPYQLALDHGVGRPNPY